MADMVFCEKFKIDFSIPIRYNTDFGGNSLFFFFMAFIAFWNQTPHIYTILPKVLGHPLLMKGLTTLVISMSTNLNV